MTNQTSAPQQSFTSGKRLSFTRILIVAIVLALLGTGGFYAWQRYDPLYAFGDSIDPWYAEYVDVTATPSYPFENEEGLPVQDSVLSFIVADTKNSCEPSWGTYLGMDQAAEELDLDRRIARLRQEGKEIAVSFGGRDNSELATVCTDPVQLAAAYRSVISHYKVETIDLDLEGRGLNKESVTRRAAVIAEIQTSIRARGGKLAVWLTLPVGVGGLSEVGTNAVQEMLRAGVDLAGVNAMTMNFGTGKEDRDQVKAITDSLTSLHRQLNAMYSMEDINLSEKSIWQKIGATPMIGQNDVASEVFTLEDAAKINAFVRSKEVGRTSMWSANRDRECGANFANTGAVSDSCSGVPQEDGEFANILSDKLVGTMSTAPDPQTTSDSEVLPEEDDPATSPYPIWSPDSSYLEGSKVVWKRNVYEAKWWTKGDQPDNPVLQEWETPWHLIGPVMPGETPTQDVQIPEDLFEVWDGSRNYEKDAVVSFDGAAFIAKWWNQGDSPAAVASDPGGTPWAPLTQEQVDQLAEEMQSGADAG